MAVDLDADGQVDLVTLSREEEEGEDGGREGEDRRRCHSMTVYWMKPQTGGPAVGEALSSPTTSSCLSIILHIQTTME